MNLLLLHPDEVADDGTARLDGRRARHVIDVLRVEPGDRIAAGVIGGRIGHATVSHASASDAEVRLQVELTADPPPDPRIDVLLALPRPKVLRRVIRHLAALGVKRIVLVNAARVEKSYFASPFLAPDALAAELILGLEQARDTVLPEVLVRPLFRPFVEDETAALWPDPARRLVAHPAAARLLDATLAGPPPAPVAIAIGPEGGFVPFEVSLLEAAGFTPVTLGPRALPVEAALVALVSACALLRAGASSNAAGPDTTAGHPRAD